MSAPAISQPPLPINKVEAARNNQAIAARHERAENRRSRWFAFLLIAICFEGLGRKYLSVIPGEAFYFLKDIALFYGIVSFPVPKLVRHVMREIFKPFGKVVVAAVVVSLVQVINTGLGASFLLGILGLRAYWLWWFVVPVVATVMLWPNVRRRGIITMSFVCAVVAIFAIIQFGSPSDSVTNMYAIHAGTEVVAFEVGSTGKARVSSTFTFITGFTDFVVLIPPLLLSLGLGEENRKARLLANVTAMLAAAALPMSGSRAPFIVGLFLLALVAREAGFLFTPIGRRVMIGGTLAIVAVIYVFPESIQGIKDRFDSDDTRSRFEAQYNVVPVLALANLDYPTFGLGTGMQQNFRNLFGVGWGRYESEAETGRLLIELGVPGYLLIWLTRFGMFVALMRAAKMFKRANRRAAAGAATAYALLVFYGSLVFDHVYQSLFFTGLGFILSELVRIWPSLHQPQKPLMMASRPPVSLGPPAQRLLESDPGLSGDKPDKT